MKYEFLQSLVIIFGVSAFVVFLLNRLKIPSLVGFLISGIIIGPFGLGLVSNEKEIETFAEIGVILLLFTLGMEFSLNKLLRMKRIVFGSGSIQILTTIASTFIITYIFFNFSIEESIFWGFLIALSSTAIVIKSISDKKETSTPQGRAMIGIVLFQDLAVVLFIILIPLMGGAIVFSLSQILVLLLKALAVIFFVIVGSKWVVPFIFEQIVKTKSRELFIISIILFCIGTAMFTNQMGLSLSLGAFLAGMMLSESDYAYQATADIVPFKESFMGLFFISIGMLLNFQFAMDNILTILILCSLLLIVKSTLGYISIKFAGFSSKTSIIAGIGIAQIGEFSFVLAMEGKIYGLIDTNLYQIFIATSILTMIITPFSYSIAHPVAAWLTKKVKSKRITKHDSLLHNKDFLSRGIKTDHVIITGFGFNGQNLANVLRKSDIPYVILDTDLTIVKKYKEKGEPIFYGDASSIDVLNHIGINNAKMLVCTISDPIMQRIIISNAKKLNDCLFIIVRTKYVKSVNELKEIGANDVIAGEFEISLEILHRVFIYYNMPLETIENTLETIRKNNYSLLRDSSKDKFAVLGDLHCNNNAEISSFKINEHSFMNGKSIKEIDIRKNSGVTILAIRRDNSLINNPSPDIKIKVNDILLFSGDRKSIKKAMDFFNSKN